jgi:hypothetical protein
VALRLNSNTTNQPATSRRAETEAEGIPLLVVAIAMTRMPLGGITLPDPAGRRLTHHIHARLGKHDVVGWLSAVGCGACGKTRRRRYRAHQERLPAAHNWRLPLHTGPAAIRCMVTTPTRLSRFPAFPSFRRLPQADRFSSTSTHRTMPTAFRNRTTRVEACRRSPTQRRAMPHSASSKRGSTRFGLARCGEP